MKRIEEIDQNLQGGKGLTEGMIWYDVRKPPFRIYGLYRPEEPGKWRRLPTEVAEKMSEGAVFLHTNTSGGRIRFRTDSKRIALKAFLPSTCIMPHMAVTGSCSFDLYADGHCISAFVPKVTYVDQFMPTFDLTNGCEAELEFEDRTMRDILIHFPLYNDVTEVLIGLEKGAALEEGGSYRQQKPVVFYGSSITQGGCASRPGNNYPAVLSRWLDFDFINLGFSGNARAEEAIGDYIAGLSMSAFVYDYDHNAPTVDYLRKTHYRMYRTVRDKNPRLPIILASRPNTCGSEAEIAERVEIILQTYERARKEGDQNIYFVSGQDILNSYDREICTVDGCHPNDFGFFCMAKAFAPVLEKVLFGEK